MNPFAKYMFIVFNTLLLFCGIILIAFGSWLLYASPIREILVVLPWGPIVSYGTIAMGVFVVAIAGFGLAAVSGGILKRKKLRVTYTILLTCVFVALLGIVAYGVSEKETFKSQFTLGWAEISNENKFFIQDRFNCCGLISSSEWNGVFDPSCLINPPTNTTTWPTGCLTPLLDWVDPNIFVLGVVAGVILIFQACLLITLIVTAIKDCVTKVDTGYDDINDKSELQVKASKIDLT